MSRSPRTAFSTAPRPNPTARSCANETTPYCAAATSATRNQGVGCAIHL
jgi:hypothetical protein